MTKKSTNYDKSTDKSTEELSLSHELAATFTLLPSFRWTLQQLQRARGDEENASEPERITPERPSTLRLHLRNWLW